MALSKRNSRPIEVDGDAYRWSFGENSGWSDVTIQSADGQGSKLIVQIPWGTSGSTTPADVATFIRLAIADGWTPNRNEGTRRMKYEGNELIGIGS